MEVDLITVFRHLKGNYKEEGDTLFSVGGRTRSSGFKLQQRKFRVN